MKKIIILSLTLILAGFSLFCFCYPFISNLINEHYNESKINAYNDNIDTIEQNEINSYFHQAEDYNRLLATDFYDKAAESDESYRRIINSYFDILNIDNGIMGYIEIPAINVNLPIYHGESEEILTKGAAHLERTSFPIGGNSTHACISAHSGFPTQKFFDDIDELETGDTVTIKVLDRTLLYTVYANEVVEPDDASKLQVISGEDILTLVTCYPYGINSHRLLVHARRTPVEVNKEATHDSTTQIAAKPERNNNNKAVIFGSVIAVTGTLAVLGIVLLKRKKNARR